MEEKIIRLNMVYCFGTDKGIYLSETAHKVEACCGIDRVYKGDTLDCSVSDSQLGEPAKIEKGPIGWVGSCWCTPETRQKREYELRNQMWDMVLAEMENLRIFNDELERSIADMEKTMKDEDIRQ